MSRILLSLCLLLELSVVLPAQDITPLPSPTPTPKVVTPSADPEKTPVPLPSVSPIPSPVAPPFDLKADDHGLVINFGSDNKKKDHHPAKAGLSFSLGNNEKDEKITADQLEDLVIPIVAILAVFGAPIAIVAFVLFYRMKKNRLLHQTIQSLVTSGQPIPPGLLTLSGSKPLPTPDSDRRKGIMLTMLGVGLIGFFLSVGGGWGIGFIPLFWGLGYLLISRSPSHGKDRESL